MPRRLADSRKLRATLFVLAIVVMGGFAYYTVNYAEPAGAPAAHTTEQTDEMADDEASEGIDQATGSDELLDEEDAATETTTTTTIATSPNAVTDKTAMSVLGELPVKGKAPRAGYSRDQFGPAWADVDHNGCDTRNDILNRDLTDKIYRTKTNNCIVLTGRLSDPYTGKTIDFKRGNKTSLAVQIDHVVALSNAWATGAQELTSAQRESLANDPYNLLAVDGDANQQKSDGDAATWLPANKSYRCQYVARQIGVKKLYNLWVTYAEKNAMESVLAGCESQTVPAY